MGAMPGRATQGVLRSFGVFGFRRNPGTEAPGGMRARTPGRRKARNDGSRRRYFGTSGGKPKRRVAEGCLALEELLSYAG